MPEEYVSLKSLAAQLGLDRSNARKYVLRLGIRPHKRRTPDSRGQLTLAVSASEAELVLKTRRDQGFLGSKPVSNEVGVFYVMQLVPELDPRRIKLGYADDIKSRLAQHRTSAPTAVLVRQWPCKRSWEETAIDCLSACSCKLILSEVFECENLDALLQRGDDLFALLPAPQATPPLSVSSPLGAGSAPKQGR